MPTDDAQERLLALLRAQVAELGLDDRELVAAIEEHVAAAAREVAVDADAGGGVHLSAPDAGQVALAAVSGAIAATATRPTPGPRVQDESTRSLLRRALSRRPRVARP